MTHKNTFGVHFVLRTNKAAANEKYPVYARITVNQTRCEFSLKHALRKTEWNFGKGLAKPKSEELRAFNSYLEEIRGKIARHYRELHVEQDGPLTAIAVKNALLYIDEPKTDYSLLWLVGQHNTLMQKVLKAGSMKNYYTTERYLKLFLAKRYKLTDMPLNDLKYEFITSFEYFIRNNSLKETDPCTTNGTMKHLERLKKMVTWAVKNEWIGKNPFTNFQLKFKYTEREFLTDLEISVLQDQEFKDPMLQRVRDYFLFSCYTGLCYIDLIELKPENIVTDIDGVRWVKTFRAKTDTAVNVPILIQAGEILEKYRQSDDFEKRDTVFPSVTNQQINRSLKIIAEICGIRKYLTFHLARHTFATSVTLLNGVPIETISKMLGHAKITTTMIYAKVTHSKIADDMERLQERLANDKSKKALKWQAKISYN